MTDSRNIGQYSRFHSNPAGSGLVDGVDFPHSGLLKALSVGLQNSYAILNGLQQTQLRTLVSYKQTPVEIRNS